ncbi:MAG: hypothetical protein ABW034_17495 [Steroidobacteraceae bacterium]
MMQHDIDKVRRQLMVSATVLAGSACVPAFAATESDVLERERSAAHKVPAVVRNSEIPKADASTRAPLLVPDEHYVASRNPVFTADQRALEELALRLWDNAVVIRGRQALARRWRTIAGRDAPQESWARFDELIEEFAFNDVLKATNSDPNYPKVLGNLWSPPRQWWGRRIPGSRGSGGDGPDNQYTIIPIDGFSRFEVLAQCFDPRPADVPFMVLTDTAVTSTGAMLDWQDVTVDGAGQFRVTLGPEAANGRRHHIQLPPDARWLFVRHCRADWRDVPIALSVQRLDPPKAPPLTEQQLADRAARWMLDHVAPMFWYMRVFAGLDANTVTAPFGTGDISGLVTQLISFIRLDLANDEAYVGTFGMGDASFRDLVVHDWWFRTIDYWERQTSLCIGQVLPNDDRTTTYVISARDPGVHNWLDTAGLRHTLLVHRWQGMPREPNRALPLATGRVVKFSELDKALPRDMRRVSPDQRRQQLLQRQRSFQLRFLSD